MLILTRRPVETIRCTLINGEFLDVVVLGVVGNQVRIGIAAPRDVLIDRIDIHERKQREMSRVNGNVADSGDNGACDGK